MQPKHLLSLLTAFALVAASAEAATLFDGASDTVLMASTTDVVLGNPVAGTWTLTSNAAAQGAYIFGNFAATTLSNVGDSITLSFTATNWPGAPNPGDVISPISFSLSGAGTSLVNTNTTLDGFSSYEGFTRGNRLSNTAYLANAFNNATNLLDAGGTSLTGGATLGNPNRFDYGGTADFTLSITRTATAFEIGGSINVAGGSGIQNYVTTTFTPGSGFQLSDAFTTFAIGIQGTSSASVQMDSGAVMTFSGITVTAIPEPGSLALVGIALGGLLLFRRRR